jgi:two-component system NtrC family sensor kinase
LECRHKDGHRVFTETSVRRLENDGEIEGFITIVRDINERRRAEEEKHKMEEQLQISGRLAAVGELVAGVAHELNNPLAAIQAYAQLLNERDDLDDTTKSDVDTIYSQAQRASRITGNLLSFARQTKPEKHPVSINEAIERSLELHNYRMKVNNIEVTTELETGLPETMADFHQLQEVFVNLITNAEQAMTEAHGRGELVVKTRKLGDMIQAEVTDDGPGIPEKNLKRIFDPFFTTKEVGKGTGLGLSICYGIVQEHGGRLYARSKPGEGTTFVVEIPLI